MLASVRRSKTVALRLATGLLAISIAGCQPPASKPGAQLPASPVAAQSADRGTAMAMLQSATALPSPERDQRQLEAAAILYGLGDNATAKTAITGVSPEQLSDIQYARYAQVYGSLLVAEDEFFQALDLATDERIEGSWLQLGDDTALPLRELRADLWGLLGDLDSAIQERKVISSLAVNESAVNANNDGLWQLLTQLPSGELQLRADETADSTMRGWYELAMVGRNTQSDLSSQLTDLARWRQAWPNHTAGMNPPQALRLLEQLATQRADSVALLLPLSGPLGSAGRAIHDGFMAAYYTSLQAGAPTPRVQVFDTAGDQSFEEIYQAAVDGGAQMIVGPLDKSKVANLLATEKLPVPTLALNYGDQGRLTNDLVQFGLAVEDEARQVARYAYRQGHRQAMVIAANTGWGQRGAEAFQEEWEQLGGKVSKKQTFQDRSNFSQLMSEALLISDSKAREATLRRKIASSLEFTPRRRGDVDMVFLLAKPQQARQINPMMTYFYAADLPVFAASHIFEGRINPRRDGDLNGVRFTALPWLFERSNETKVAIEKMAAPSAAFSRLYALGADAFRLYPRLPMLRQFPQQKVYGLTGALSLSPDGRIIREQIWAQIEQGTPRPVTSVPAPAIVSQERPAGAVEQAL